MAKNTNQNLNLTNEQKADLLRRWELKKWREKTYPFLEAVNDAMHYLSIYKIKKEKNDD